MFGNDLREGMRATVICSILSGDSPLSLVWYKGHQLAKTVHPEIEILSFGEFTSTFQIKNVKRSHSGNYTCTASTDKVSVNYTTEMIVQGETVINY
jgi:cell adhesion molecule, putative (fragment)